jgi:hypothetical protein
MNHLDVIRLQYHAALEMLRQSVLRCPEELWDDADGGAAFWHVAYHALFYTNLYLSESEATFQRWPGCRDTYHLLAPAPWPPYHGPEITEPYTPPEVLDYLAFCDAQVDVLVPAVALSAESGFDWLPMSRFELHIYNIRHLQQHTGELMERLGSRAGVEVDWVGMGPTGPN